MRRERLHESLKNGAAFDDELGEFQDELNNNNNNSNNNSGGYGGEFHNSDKDDEDEALLADDDDLDALNNSVLSAHGVPTMFLNHAAHWQIKTELFVLFDVIEKDTSTVW